MKPAGRLVVVSFHSRRNAIVKEFSVDPSIFLFFVFSWRARAGRYRGIDRIAQAARLHIIMDQRRSRPMAR